LYLEQRVALGFGIDFGLERGFCHLGFGFGGQFGSEEGFFPFGCVRSCASVEAPERPHLS
jgi:hypothetical protein